MLQNNRKFDAFYMSQQGLIFKRKKPPDGTTFALLWTITLLFASASANVSENFVLNSIEETTTTTMSSLSSLAPTDGSES